MSVEMSEKVWEITLNSDCQCYDCVKCGVGYVGTDPGQKCDECEVELVSADSCIGCWDDSESNFYEALEAWRNSMGVNHEVVRIEATGMGWQRVSGYSVKPFNKALEALTIRGDFRIEAKWEDKTFSARRYSHDEPTGSAVFNFTLIEEEG
jgi:hypothetical protein